MPNIFDQCLVEADRLHAFDPAHPLLRYILEPNNQIFQREFMEHFGSKESDPSDSSTLRIVERIEEAYQRYLNELHRAINDFAQDCVKDT